MLLLVQPEYPPAVGGMQTHAAALARGLHDRGHRIAVVTYAQPEDPDSAAAASTYDELRPFPTFRCLSRMSYWANLERIQRLADRCQPHLIYSSTPFYGLLAGLAGVPVVCRSVGTDVMRCWIPYPFRWGSRIVAQPRVERLLEGLYRKLRTPDWVDGLFFEARRRLVSQGARSASALVANSSYTRDRLLELGVAHSAISVVAGGVDAAVFARRGREELEPKSRPAGRGPRLLTVCRLVRKKGIDVLLQATALAQKELPGLELVIAGDGPERERCQLLAGQLSLNGTVRFVGKVPHEQIVRHYHAADFFVLASRVHQRRQHWADVETMGRVICEANAAGLPVVATETGGVPSLISHGENGLLVPPDDPAALASTIVRLWDSPGLQIQMRESGLRRARQQFDWAVVVRAFETIFERALSDGIRAHDRPVATAKASVRGVRP